MRIENVTVCDRGTGWQVEILWEDGVLVPQFCSKPFHDGFIQLADCWNFIRRHDLFPGKSIETEV